MPDYKVSVGVETTTPGRAAAEMRKTADAVEQIGTSSKTASREVDALAVAQKRVAIEQQRVLDVERNLAAMRARGRTQTQQYRQETERYVAAQERLLTAMNRQESLSRRQAQVAGATGLVRNVGAGLAGYAVGRRLGTYASDSAQEASDLAQVARTGVEVFGEYQKVVDRFGQSAAKNLGLSKLEVQDAAVGFGVLFENLRIGDEAAAKMSVRLVDIGANLAALRNTSADQGISAVEGVFRGEYDAAERFGLQIDETKVKTEAMRLGLIKARTDGLDPSARAQAAYSLVLQQGAIATGAIADRSEDLAIRQQQAQAAMANARAELGRGLVPVMNGAATILVDDLLPALSGLNGLLGAIGSNTAARRTLEGIVLVGGGAIALVKTKKLLGEVRDVLRIGSAKTIVENTAVARSYDAVAAAAGRATVAQTASATSGPLGKVGKRGRAGSLLSLGGRVPGAVGGVGAAAAAVGLFGINSIDTAKRQQRYRDAGGDVGGIDVRRGIRPIAFDFGDLSFSEKFLTGPSDEQIAEQRRRLNAMTVRNAMIAADRQRASTARQSAAAREFKAAQARADAARTAAAQANVAYQQAVAYAKGGYKADAANAPLGGLLDELPERPDVDITGFRDRLTSAQRALAIAQARARQRRAGSGGGSAAQIASAQAAVLTARDATRRPGGNREAEALKLQAAEARLSRLRQGGRVDTIAILQAEKSLDNARRKVRDATKDLTEAEREANGDRSLSLKEVLNRAAFAARTGGAEVVDVRKLVRAGITKPVLDELLALEKSSPGTVRNVAKGLTKGYVEQLNADSDARDKAAEDLANLGAQAKVLEASRAAGKANGAAFAAGLLEAAAAGTSAALAAGLFSGAGNVAKLTAAQSAGLFSGAGMPRGIAAGIASGAAAGGLAGGVLRLDDATLRKIAQLAQPVALQVQGVRGEQVRRIAQQAVADFDRSAGGRMRR